MAKSLVQRSLSQVNKNSQTTSLLTDDLNKKIRTLPMLGKMTLNESRYQITRMLPKSRLKKNRLLLTRSYSKKRTQLNTIRCLLWPSITTMKRRKSPSPSNQESQRKRSHSSAGQNHPQRKPAALWMSRSRRTRVGRAVSRLLSRRKTSSNSILQRPKRNQGSPRISRPPKILVKIPSPQKFCPRKHRRDRKLMQLTARVRFQIRGGLVRPPQWTDPRSTPVSDTPTCLFVNPTQ